jgi:hypothetical protein
MSPVSDARLNLLCIPMADILTNTEKLATIYVIRKVIVYLKIYSHLFVKTQERLAWKQCFTPSKICSPN